MDKNKTIQQDSVSKGQDFTYPHRWVAMFALMSANFMIFLDVNIVLVAIPSIQSNLHATMIDMEWIVAVYILCYALSLLPLGRLGDILGRRQLFLFGLGGFVIASCLCGAANSVSILIFARILQALTAAMITPQVMAIATSMFAPRERATVFSLFGIVAGLAAILGPVASGFLVNADLFGLGWRSIFYINVPIGTLVFFVALRRIPNTLTHSGQVVKHDWFGMLLVAVAILCLMFPLIEGRSYHWPLWSFFLIATFFLLMALFVRHSIRQAKINGPTLLPIYLMANRNYIVGSLAVMVFFSAMQGFLLIFIIFLQKGHSFTALQTGLTTVPFPVGILVATIISAKFKSLRFKIFIGSFLCFVSGIWLWVTVDSITHLEANALILPLFIGGIGAGITIASLFQTVMRTVPLKDAGSGSGALQAIQQVGSTLGIAFMSQLFFSRFADQLNIASYDVGVVNGYF